MLGVALAFVIIDITGFNDVVNSDWPSFATGGRLIVSDPTHLYDFEVQRRVELDVTGGRSLVTPGIQGFLPFLAPAWVAFLAAPRPSATSPSSCALRSIKAVGTEAKAGRMADEARGRTAR